MSGFFDYSDDIKYPIYFVECNSPTLNATFRETIDKYHSYKKFKSSPTRNLRWLIYQTDNSQLLGAIGISSCVLAIKCRDDYIGWSRDIRLSNSNKIANNSRFCLISGATNLKNVASMTLKVLKHVAAVRWKEKYGDDLIMLETYVEPVDANNIYRSGSCYKASGWTYVGATQGNSIRKAPIKMWAQEDSFRGRLTRKDPKAAAEKYGYNSAGFVVTTSTTKLVFIKPLVADWRNQLCNG